MAFTDTARKSWSFFHDGLKPQQTFGPWKTDDLMRRSRELFAQTVKPKLDRKLDPQLAKALRAQYGVLLTQFEAINNSVLALRQAASGNDCIYFYGERERACSYAETVLKNVLDGAVAALDRYLYDADYAERRQELLAQASA
jgi:hypothetical protein